MDNTTTFKYRTVATLTNGEVKEVASNEYDWMHKRMHTDSWVKKAVTYVTRTDKKGRTWEQTKRTSYPATQAARLTIWDIKRRVEAEGSKYFSHSTLKYFGQKVSDFKVYKQSDGRWMICAPRKDGNKLMGESIRYFNPETNKLDLN